MGQHKYNPNCQLAREGKLPPKPKKMSKRESERLLYAECQRILLQPLVKDYVKMQKYPDIDFSVPAEKEKGERENDSACNFEKRC